jgi:hypothetical protein
MLYLYWQYLFMRRWGPPAELYYVVFPEPAPVRQPRRRSSKPKTDKPKARKPKARKAARK